MLPAWYTFAPWTAVVGWGRIPGCSSRRLTPVDCAVKGHFSRSGRQVQVSSLG